MHIRREIAAIDAELQAAGSPDRAEGEKRYLKSDLHFLGVSVPEVRRTAHRWLQLRPGIGRGDLVRLVRALWRRRTHELRSFGVELLRQRIGLLQSQDLELVEELLNRANTWAHVDELAVHVAGSLVERFPRCRAALDAWAASDNLWLRRSSLLALLPPLRRGEGDWRRFTRLADGMLEDKEFFIRKAVGWVLREASKKTPDRVDAYLVSRLPRMPRLTLREAVKHLPRRRRDELLAS